MNKAKLITDMLKLLHAANCAGCEDTDYSELSDEYNSQAHLFGHLADALKLIAPDIYAAYIDTGEPDYVCSVATARHFPNDHWLYVEAAERQAAELFERGSDKWAAETKKLLPCQKWIMFSGGK